MPEPLRKEETTKDLSYRLNTAPEQSRAQYRILFNESPISIWEEDFSNIKDYVNRKITDGVKNIYDYLKNHPIDIENLAKSVKINDVNIATLRMYKAGSREELEKGLNRVFGPKTYNIFVEEISSLANGQTIFTGNTINETLTGEKLHINLKMCLVPGYESDWSKILVFITKQYI